MGNQTILGVWDRKWLHTGNGKEWSTRGRDPPPNPECCSLWSLHRGLAILAVFGYHEPGCWHWPGYMNPTMSSLLNTSQWLFSRISTWKYPPWLKDIERVEPHSISTWWLRSLGSGDLNWPPFAGQGRRRERHRLRKQICNAGHILHLCDYPPFPNSGCHSSPQGHDLPLDDGLCCYPVSCKMTLALEDLIPFSPRNNMFSDGWPEISGIWEDVIASSCHKNSRVLCNVIVYKYCRPH